MSDSAYAVHVIMVDETQGCSYYDEVEPLDAMDVDEETGPDVGWLFKTCQREYGRCQSSVYVENAEGAPRKVGWYFVKRCTYEEYRYGWKPETYLRGTWVTLVTLCPTYQPRKWQTA